MKPIERKKLIEAAKSGNADKKLVAQVMMGTVPAEKPAAQIDDREPMDRVADELARFTDAVQELTRAQATAMAGALKQMLAAVEAIATNKDKALQPMKLDPVQIDIADSRPRAWEVTVTGRDRAGHIETVQVSAKHREKMN